MDETLDGLLPPDPYSFLEGVQLSLTVSTWVTNLELDEQFECGLVRLLLETLHYLRPVVLEDIAMATSPFVIEHSVGPRADRYAASASI